MKNPSEIRKYLTSDGLFDILGFSKDEEKYVEYIKNDEYIVFKYKEYLGILRVFEGVIEPINN